MWRIWQYFDLSSQHSLLIWLPQFYPQDCPLPMISLKNAVVVQEKAFEPPHLSLQTGTIDLGISMMATDLRNAPENACRNSRKAFVCHRLDRRCRIGNAYASEAELALGAIDRYQTVFAIEFVPEINGWTPNRPGRAALPSGDITDRMIRSTEVRKV